jgi:hypothetical protein
VAVRRAELFDPVSETWKAVAEANNPRTYHNTAMLLPDGRVLVGGHAPINTAYLFSVTLPGFSPNDGRDPSFEIYNPPYVFRSGRPTISSVSPGQVSPGDTITIATSSASSISKVVLIRRTATTHLVDGDQRAVSLPILSRSSGSLKARIPASPAVVPAGPYMLFAVRATSSGPLPSISKPVTVLGADAACSDPL